MSWILVGLVFILGAAVGSFVNVLVARSVAGEDWLRGRSRCDYCRRELAWYDLIPLLSYIIYQGKSRCCGKPLSLAHPIVEGLFGILFVWWLMVGFVFFQLATSPWSVIQPMFWLGIASILLLLAVADVRYGYILMPVVWVGAGWIYLYRGLLYLSGNYELRDLGRTLLAGILSFLFLWMLRVLTRGRGMGDGDPYLAFVTGSLLPGVTGFYGMLLAFILGSIWGLGLLLFGKKAWQDSIPFGPFIIAGAVGALLFSRF